MNPLAKIFVGFAIVFILAGVVLFAWSGCEDMLKSRIYRGPNKPADVVLFGTAYPPDVVPLLVRMAHGYGWIPLLLLGYGSYKLAESMGGKSRNE